MILEQYLIKGERKKAGTRVTRYNKYQGNSERIREFLSYSNKESSEETNMRNLTIFEDWIKNEYKTELDALFVGLETNQIDVYKLLGKYLQYLKTLKGRQPNTLKNRISVVKSLISTTTKPTVGIDKVKLHHFVKLPVVNKKGKKGLSKELTIKLINATFPYKRLRMIIWFLAATGCRIDETLRLRCSDLHLDGEPHFGLRPPYLPYVHMRAEITKTQQERTVILTSEIKEQLELWIKEKYKVRNKVTTNNDGSTITEKVKPERHPNDYLFINIDRNYDKPDAARFVYRNLVNQLSGILHNLGLTDRTANGQFAITFHKIRIGVRTRITDIKFKDCANFADFFIGHDTSTYFNPTEDQYKNYFKMCESELTYLDPMAVQQKYGAMEEQIENDRKEITQLKVAAKGMFEMLQKMSTKFYPKKEAEEINKFKFENIFGKIETDENVEE